MVKIESFAESECEEFLALPKMLTEADKSDTTIFDSHFFRTRTTKGRTSTKECKCEDKNPIGQNDKSANWILVLTVLFLC